MEARYTIWIAVRNTFIIFLLSGFWHGANWTFVLWGAYHAMLFVPLLLLGKNRRYRDTVATITLPDGTIKTKWLPSLKETGQILLTFALVVFGWIIFRAENIGQVGDILKGMCNSSIFSMPYLISPTYILPIPFILFIMLGMEWKNRTNEHGMQNTTWKSREYWVIYLFLLAMLLFFTTQTASFIYFQF